MRIVTALVCRHKSPRRWWPHRTPRKQDESDAPQQKNQPFKLHPLNIITNKRIRKKGRIAAVPFEILRLRLRFAQDDISRVRQDDIWRIIPP